VTSVTIHCGCVFGSSFSSTSCKGPRLRKDAQDEQQFLEQANTADTANERFAAVCDLTSNSAITDGSVNNADAAAVPSLLALRATMMSNGEGREMAVH
jgi:hypothetical protein